MSPRPTAEQSALLLALMFKRSNVASRIRISEKTLRRVAGRKNLRLTFLGSLVEELDDLGYAMLQIEVGWSLIRLDQLNGAQAVTASKYLADELAARKRGVDVYDQVRMELGLDSEESDDEA